MVAADSTRIQQTPLNLNLGTVVRSTKLPVTRVCSWPRADPHHQFADRPQSLRSGHTLRPAASSNSKGCIRQGATGEELRLNTRSPADLVRIEKFTYVLELLGSL